MGIMRMQLLHMRDGGEREIVRQMIQDMNAKAHIIITIIMLILEIMDIYRAPIARILSLNAFMQAVYL